MGVVEDTSIDSRFHADVGTRCCDGPFSRGRHVLYPQVFNTDDAVVFGYMGGQLVGKVVPSPCLSGA